MHQTANYPIENLFHSQTWAQRITALGLDTPKFYSSPFYSMTLAFQCEGLLSDFETWPSDDIMKCGDFKSDWVVVRKLLPEQAREDELDRLKKTLPIHKRPVILPYSNSPYLDLTKPLNPQKNKIAHVYRTERKLTREIGKPELREFNTAEERAQWFEWFASFQASQGRLPDNQREALQKWVLEGEKPEWMRLICLMVGDVALVAGLFYYWKGVFYYYSSAMNPDPAYRKYGPGKLMVEKLIHYTIAQGGEIFDFLQGDHSYKSHWNPQSRMLFQWIGPVTIKGSIALQFLRLKNKVRASFPADAETVSEQQPAIEQECTA